MENKEYYTPTIEELFIGYELEMPIHGEYENIVGWKKKIVNCIGIIKDTEMNLKE